MKSVKHVLIGVTGAIATIPGIAEIRSALVAPPEHGNLFGGVAIASGSLLFLVLVLLRKSIRQASSKAVMILSVASFVGFAVLLSTYLFVNSKTLFRNIPGEHCDPNRAIYVPLWPTGKLREAFDDPNMSRGEFLRTYPRGTVELLAGQDSELLVTTILGLVLYSGTLSALILTFGILGFHIATEHEKTEANS